MELGLVAVELFVRQEPDEEEDEEKEEERSGSITLLVNHS
jgi:hypothetical protein